MFYPFDNVGCKYGAPMGRVSAPLGNLADVPKDKLAVQWQGGGDGYDKGGAYWGLPSNVYAVWEEGNGPDTVQYLRAYSLGDALDKVESGDYVGCVDSFTQAYIEAMYFTDGQGIDEDEFGPDDQLSTKAFNEIKEDCVQFQESAKGMLEDAYAQGGYDAAQAGHDFWLTRNGHGAGFWGRSALKGALGYDLSTEARSFGPVHAYKGKDGFIHLEGG